MTSAFNHLKSQVRLFIYPRGRSIEQPTVPSYPASYYSSGNSGRDTVGRYVPRYDRGGPDHRPRSNFGTLEQHCSLANPHPIPNNDVGGRINPLPGRFIEDGMHVTDRYVDLTSEQGPLTYRDTCVFMCKEADLTIETHMMAYSDLGTGHPICEQVSQDALLTHVKNAVGAQVDIGICSLHPIPDAYQVARAPEQDANVCALLGAFRYVDLIVGTLVFDNDHPGTPMVLNETRTFATVAGQLGRDESRLLVYQQKTADVRINYLILFNGRAGSSWLSGVLESHHLGRPYEHINPEFLRHNAQHYGVNDQGSYMDAIRGETSVDGVFGIEATSEHITIFGEDAFFDALPNVTVFHLWRQNQVAQAVSLYRAVSTGFFHSSGTGNPSNPRYDGQELLNWYRYLAAVENENFALLERRRLWAQPLVYEWVQSEEAVINIFNRVLGTTTSTAKRTPKEELKKIAGDWNRMAEDEFRNSYAREIQDIEFCRRANQYNGF